MLWMQQHDLKKGNGVNAILNYQGHLLSEYSMHCSNNNL